jgi:cytosine deaminase
MGLNDAGLFGLGRSADLVVFRARSFSELLSRPQSDRVVLRAGLLADAKVPDYRELDGLFE